MEDLQARAKQVQEMKIDIISMIPPAGREEALKRLDKLLTTTAMIATDIAIKATTDQFVAKIKEAAEEGKAQAEAKDGN